MMGKHILFAICCLSFFAVSAVGQQQPQISLYEENKIYINPAYAGIHDDQLAANAAYRLQWMDLKENAPSSALISAHAPLDRISLGIGGYVLHDQTGPSGYSEVGLSINYQFYINKYYTNAVYRNEFNEIIYRKISIGLGGGVAQYRLDGSKLFEGVNAGVINDPAIVNKTSSIIWPTASIGFMYNAPRMYVSVSANQLLSELTTPFTADGDETIIQRDPHIYGMVGGRMYTGNREVVVEPSFLVKYAPTSPVQADINVKVKHINFGWVGLGYRSANTLKFQAGVIVKNAFTFGYAYDYALANFQQHFGYQTHEVALHYRLNLSWH